MNIYQHNKRFGVTAVQMDLIIEDQLIEAMRMQIEFDIKGADHRMIGEILVEIGYMDSSDVDKVLKAMNENI